MVIYMISYRSIGGAVAASNCTSGSNEIEVNKDDRDSDSLNSTSDDISSVDSRAERTQKDHQQILMQVSAENSPAPKITENENEIEENQQQPDWSTTYQLTDDDEPLINPVSTRDLIFWVFQIARGMDYLASKKVYNYYPPPP